VLHSLGFVPEKAGLKSSLILCAVNQYEAVFPQNLPQLGNCEHDISNKGTIVFSAESLHQQQDLPMYSNVGTVTTQLSDNLALQR